MPAPRQTSRGKPYMNVFQGNRWNRQIRVWHLAFLSCLAAAVSRGQQAGYFAVDLGTLAGNISSYSTAINVRGQIVGGIENANGVVHAFLYYDNTMTDLGAFSYSGSSALTPSTAYAINISGLVVGASGTGIDQPASFSPGTATFLGTIYGNGGTGDAYGVND